MICEGVNMNIKQRKILILSISVILLIVCIIGVIVNHASAKQDRKEISENGFKKTTADKAAKNGINIKEDFLEVNSFSRPATPLTTVNNIVVHYVANPGSTAQDNRNYFNGLAASGETYASSHYVIGLEGEIIQCIPLNEIAYCSNNRNDDTVSIEVCHPDEDGKFTKDSYNALVGLCAWLCNAYELKPEDIIRHYDITGKICPKYFVDNPDEWKKFKKDVGKKLR